jgi:hypothetical protein
MFALYPPLFAFRKNWTASGRIVVPSEKASAWLYLSYA